jgi:hypothetical protein
MCAKACDPTPWDKAGLMVYLLFVMWETDCHYLSLLAPYLNHRNISTVSTPGTGNKSQTHRTSLFLTVSVRTSPCEAEIIREILEEYGAACCPVQAACYLNSHVRCSVSGHHHRDGQTWRARGCHQGEVSMPASTSGCGQWFECFFFGGVGVSGKYVEMHVKSICDSLVNRVTRQSPALARMQDNTA